MLPQPPATPDQIENDSTLRALIETGWTQDELLRGHDGEAHWHRLPSQLREEWLQFVENYQRDGALDGPCFWLDLETRKCKHHEYRPQVCRDFETGSDACREWRNEYREMIRINSR